MNQKKAVKKPVLLIIQLLLVIIAFFAVILYVRKETQPMTVYQFTRDIKYDAEKDYLLQPSDVQAISIAKSAVTPNIITNIGDIQGKYLNCDVYAGEYIINNHLKEEGDAEDPIAKLGSDYRLITLPVSMSTTLGGTIETGETIDLMYSGTGSTEDEATGESYSFTYTKLFMQNVMVYKMTQADGSDYVPYDSGSEQLTSGTTESLNGEENTGGGSPAYMTLAVSVSQAEEIYARTLTGNISFVKQLDQSEEVTPLGFVVGEYSKIFLGQGNAESNGLYVDSDIEGANKVDVNKEAAEGQQQ